MNTNFLCLRAARFFLTSIFFLTAFLAIGTIGYAQGSTVRVRDLSSSERELSALESESNRKKRDPQTIMAEINEDFSRLRVIKDEIKAAHGSAQLDYKNISDNAVEIKKRGTRLRADLAALPKADKSQKESVPLNEAHMRSLLSSVHDVLNAFLSNPVFSDMGSLDNQLALKARRDLENLIGLSEVMKTGADKLSKNSPK
jgi:septal ring factor EnvC (AmiA/AmiB activator)